MQRAEALSNSRKMDLTRTYLEFFKFGEKEIRQILENQEDCKKLRMLGMMNDVLKVRAQKAERIVEQLKIKIIDFHEGVSAKAVCKELQKILVEEK